MAVSKPTTAEPATSVQNVFSVPLDPWPIGPELIRAGKPVAKGMVIARSDDRRTFTGVWECTPGTFDWTYTWDETISVVAGRVTITDLGGEARTFKTGDVVHFPIGLHATWAVHETVRKVYALISPEPLDL
jgi:uncharacterized cupin superfamily protein